MHKGRLLSQISVRGSVILSSFSRENTDLSCGEKRGKIARQELHFEDIRMGRLIVFERHRACNCLRHGSELGRIMFDKKRI